MLEKVRNRKVFGWPFATKRRRILIAAILALIVLFRLNAARKPDFEVDVHIVKSGDFVQSITASGEVKAENATDLTFIAAEQISQIYVKDGDWVKMGQRIASLNTTNLYHNLKIAEENLRAKAAALDVVYDDLQGKENSETFEEISTRTTAEAAKNNAVFAHIQAQRNLANATIIAPFNGIITFKDGVSVGKYASAAAPSFSIVDPGTVYIDAEISELDVIKVSPGIKAVVELDAYPNERFDELLEVIGFESVVTSSGGTAYKTKISLTDNTNNRFRLGMNGDVDLIIAEHNKVLSVPISAIVEEEKGNYVWKVVDGSVLKVEIEEGVSSLNDIEILSGLDEGDVVVIRPPSKMEEGNSVKVTNEN